MWRKVAHGQDLVLLLEDDAILSLEAVRIMNDVLTAMRNEQNFILKLLNIGHVTNPMSIGVSAQSHTHLPVFLDVMHRVQLAAFL